MNGYFPPQPAEGGEENMMGNMDGNGMENGINNGMNNGMNNIHSYGAQSLDDIVNENTKAMRRGSVPPHYSNNDQMRMSEPDIRRLSMMEFSGTSPGGQLDQYAFDPSTPTVEGMNHQSLAMPRPSLNASSRHTSNDLFVNSQYSGQGSPYTTGPVANSTYASPLPPNSGFDMDMASPYLAGDLGIPMDKMDPNFNTPMGPSSNPMDMYQPNQFGSPMIGSPVNAEFGTPIQSQQTPSAPMPDIQEGRMSVERPGPGIEGRSSRTNSGRQSVPSSRPHSAVMSNRSSQSHTPQLGTPQMGTPQLGPPHQIQPTQKASDAQLAQNQMPAQPKPRPVQGPDPPPTTQNTQETMTQLNLPWTVPTDGFPSSMAGYRPHMESNQYKSAYSSSGFDMLGVLMRVATRPKPEINIGSVDLSCAFVVCDAEADDFPIVYCSENFERLTGYDRHQILGRNCRFLQSPDGNVQAGNKRHFVDDDAVLYLKNMITMRREAQISLINYRRGGQPFMNLLTMIPISWDQDNVVKFFVGFQVDLVEQPNAVTNKNADGTYAINYQRSSLPRYIVPGVRSQNESGQTVSRDEVSQILGSIGTSGTDSEFTRRLWDKVLLENVDDVVHVLSLKGLFLYLSPSCKRVLEYEPSELVGAALSSVCHPSDIVPTTRELKDTTNGITVNVVFRMRRKESGYMWFEGHGALHTEQGKGRKCIILVGRERPVYTLGKNEMLDAGGIGDNELWTKMSTSGMFLFISSNVRQLLDRQPEELVGTSIQSLMRTDSKQEFGRILMIVQTGKKASVRHEMMNKRGQILQAFSTVYPGDAVEGQKPTFVIAQTRMPKFSRGSTQAAQRSNFMSGNSGNKSDTSPGGAALPTDGSVGSALSGGNTPASVFSTSQYVSTNGVAATFAGQDGLPLGRQDDRLASEENLFEELKTTRSTSWQFELRHLEKQNRFLAEEVQNLLAAKKKRKRRKGAGQLQKDCVNCHTRVTPEWRRGPSGNRDLCNSCGLRWAKQQGRVSPRTSSQHSASGKSDKASKASASPHHEKTHASHVSHGTHATDGGAGHISPQTRIPDDPPSKVQRVDYALGTPSGGVGAASSAGVPPKIDEDDEPD